MNSIGLSYLSRVAVAYEGMAVSRFALHKIRGALIQENLANNEEIVGALGICRKCSEKLTPGKSCDFRLEKVRKRSFKNAVVYTCKRCKSKTRMKGVEKKDEKIIKTERNEPKKYTEADIQKILNKIPTNHRNLNGKKPNKPKEEKKSLVDSFFENPGNNLYSLFH